MSVSHLPVDPSDLDRAWLDRARKLLNRPFISGSKDDSQANMKERSDKVFDRIRQLAELAETDDDLLPQVRSFGERHKALVQKAEEAHRTQSSDPSGAKKLAVQVSHDLGELKTALKIAIAAATGDLSTVKSKTKSLAKKGGVTEARKVEFDALDAALSSAHARLSAVGVASNPALARLLTGLDSGRIAAGDKRKLDIEAAIAELIELKGKADEADQLAKKLEEARASYVLDAAKADGFKAELTTLGQVSGELNAAIVLGSAKHAQHDFLAAVEALKKAKDFYKAALKAYDKSHPGERKAAKAWRAARAPISEAYEDLSTSGWRDEPELKSEIPKLRRALDGSDAQAAAGDFDKATATLKGAQSDVKAANKAREAARSRKLAEHKAEPVVKDLRARLNAYLAKHEGEQAHRALSTKVKAKVDEANRLIALPITDKGPRFVEAKAELEAAEQLRIDTTKLMVQNQAVAMSDKVFKAAHVAMTKSLGELAPLMEATEHLALKAESDLALAIASQSSSAIPRSIAAMNGRDEAHKELIKARKQAKADCEAAFKSVTDKIAEYDAMVKRFKVDGKEVPPPAPLPTRKAILDGRVEAIRNGMDARRYPDMLASLETVVKEATQLFVDGTNATVQFVGHQLEWRKAKKPEPTELKRLKQAAPTAAYGRGLSTAWSHATSLAAKGEFEDAVLELNEPMQGLAEALEAAAAFEEVADARERADALVAASNAAAVKEIEAFEAAVAVKLEGMYADPPTEPAAAFRRRVATAQAAWEAVRDSALSETALKAGREAAEAALAAVEADAKKAKTSDSAIQAVADTEKRGQQQARYEATRKDLLATLEEIREHDYTRVPAFEAALAKLDEAVAKSPEASIVPQLVALGDLGNDATQARKDLRSLFHQTRNDVNLTAAPIERGLETLLEELGSDDPKAPFKPVFLGLKKELDDLRPMRSSYDLHTLQAARPVLSKLQTRFTDLKAKLEDTSDGGFTDVLVHLDAIRLALARKAALATCQPTVRQKLEAEFKELEQSIFELDPTAGLKKAKAFYATVVKAENDASAFARQRAEFAALLPAVHKGLAALDKTHAKSMYVKELRGRVAGASKGIDEEGGEEVALKALKDVETEVAEAANAKTFLDKEAAARAAVVEAAETRTNWEGELKLFENGLLKQTERALKAARKDGIDPDTDLLDQIKKMVKESKGAAKREDFKTADTQLSLARDKARSLIDNPGGEKASARGNLAGDLTRYKKAVGDWNASWSAFFGDLDKAAKVQPAVGPGVTKAKDLINKRLTVQYNLTGFDAPVETLSNSEDRDAQRAAREAALRTLESYKALMLTSPLREAAIAKNPFPTHKKTIEKAERALFYALESLETNLLRSV